MARGSYEMEQALEELTRWRLQIEDDMQRLQQSHELVAIQYQERFSIQAQLSQLGQLGPTEVARLQQRLADVEASLLHGLPSLLQLRMAVLEKLQVTCQLTRRTLNCLLDDELASWQRRQQLAGNGGPHEGSLDMLQTWFSSLAEILVQLGQQARRLEIFEQQMPGGVPCQEGVRGLIAVLRELLNTLLSRSHIKHIDTVGTQYQSVWGYCTTPIDHERPRPLKAFAAEPLGMQSSRPTFPKQQKHIQMITDMFMSNDNGDTCASCSAGYYVVMLESVPHRSLVIERQPPQVLKTQTRFCTSLRLLLGNQLGTSLAQPQVRASIISEWQARAILNGQLGPNESIGEIANSCASMERQQTNNTLLTNFKNMSLRKIRRSDRRGVESVTEEKFALLFQTQLNLEGEAPIAVRALSLPVAVTVHGSQENNATATILWDNAFAEPGRLPFQVPEKVAWWELASVLSTKFQAEMQSLVGLSESSLAYLARKAFSHVRPPTSGDYNNSSISWAQFNRENLPGRNFTFWQWFDGVIELTKKHLKVHWNDGAILGFIGKREAQDLLLGQPSGSFLLRFSDSEIGGITFAWVAEVPGRNGERAVWNVQPFTSKDLTILSLPDRLRDFENLKLLYPAQKKAEVFGAYYSPPPATLSNGYVRAMIRAVVSGLVNPSPPLELPDPIRP
uniref:signal transducer and activator of transcription 5B-like n=1 Tax=Myxine glutinosa TaxID=7769 RepID=UPI00358E98B9